MQTSQKSIFDIIEETSTSLAGASPANPTAPQANDLEKKMTATSGQRCCDAFERFPRVGSWAKTFSALLIGQAGWSSTRCRLTWKLKGTRFNRMYFQLQASTLPTEEIGSGLLPTATAQDFKRRGPNSKQQGLSNTENWTGMLLTPTSVMTDEPPEKMRERAERNGYKNGTQYGSLLSQVKYSGMLPTPNATDHKDKPTSKSWKEQGAVNYTLGNPEIRGMLPTPNSRDYKDNVGNGIDAPSIGKTRGYSLGQKINSVSGALPKEEAGKSSQLNPPFVAEMMGFPTDWTILPFLSGETKASKPTGTP